MDSQQEQPRKTTTPPRPVFNFPSSSPTISPSPADDRPDASTPSLLLSARYRQMKRFARSADKRQSVHMLGSIQHLQKHFMKFGLETTEEYVLATSSYPSELIPFDDNRNETSPSTLATIPSDAEEAPNVHSTPLPPATVSKPPFPLFETPKIDPGQLKHDAVSALRRMEDAWRIHSVTDDDDDEASTGKTGVLELLRVTTDAIRAVRAWSLALPPSAIPLSAKQELKKSISTHSAKPRISSISTPSRPSPTPMNGLRSVSGGLLASTGKSEQNTEGNEGRDPFSELRKCALDVLVSLRGLEERFRDEAAEGDSSMEEEPPTEQVVEGNVNKTPEQRQPILGEPDDLWVFTERTDLTPSTAEDQADKKSTWYERLAAAGGGGGWVYRDVSIPEELGEEVRVIETYLEAVRETLFPGTEGGSPWRKGERRAGDGEGEDVFGTPGVMDQIGRKEIPEWAADERWEGKADQRILAFMRANLPTSLALVLPTSSTEHLRTALLSRLSDGYLVIHAFNAVLRETGSWGFIPDEDVHDTLTLSEDAGEEGEGVKKPRDWTFRRAGNLRCWGAALKMRYGIPLVFPVQAGGTAMSYITDTSREATPSPSRRPSAQEGAEGVAFDPVRIARRDEGWDGTLERVIGMWIDRVVVELKREL